MLIEKAAITVIDNPISLIVANRGQKDIVMKIIVIRL
jgi:hypothetical protein